MRNVVYTLKDGQLYESYVVAVNEKNPADCLLERHGNGKIMVGRKASRSEFEDSGADFIFVKYAG